MLWLFRQKATSAKQENKWGSSLNFLYQSTVGVANFQVVSDTYNSVILDFHIQLLYSPRAVFYTIGSKVTKYDWATINLVNQFKIMDFVEGQVSITFFIRFVYF